MSIHDVLNKQKHIISSFKIKNSKEKSLIKKEPLSENTALSFHDFSLKNTSFCENCPQKFDFRSSNFNSFNKFISEWKYKHRAPIKRSLQGKNFSKGLKLIDIQYECGILKQKFGKNDSKAKYYKRPCSKLNPSKGTEIIDKIEDMNKKEKVRRSSGQRSKEVPNFQSIHTDLKVDAEKKMEYSLENTESDIEIFPILQKNLSNINNCIFPQENIQFNIITKKKVETFISKCKFDETSGFNMNDLASFPGILTFEEVEKVKFEFKIIPAMRKYEKLDEILQKLKFFKKFTKIVRISILKQSNLLEYGANEKIFSEGDYGDLMYIIVKGGVNIRLKRKLNFRDLEPIDIVVNSYYDGDHFGDLAMMSVKKNESIQNKAKQINLNELNIQDIRAYLKNFYENKNLGYENNLDSKAFDEEKQLRNSFLAQKSKNYFGIKVKDQEIERTKRTATVETIEKTVFIALPRDKFQRIFFSILQQNIEEKIESLLQNSAFANFEPYLLLPFAYYLKEAHYNVGEIVITEGDPLKYFYIISKGRCEVYLAIPNPVNIKILRDNDIFGARAIFTTRDFERMTGRNGIELNIENELKAKLSIKAESTKLEIYYIDKASFELLPLDLKNEIRQKLLEIKDFDELDVKQIRVDSIIWEKQSKKIKNTLLKRNLYKKL